MNDLKHFTKRNIYFYEVYASNYNRYVIKVAESLYSKENINIFFIKENYDKEEINITSNSITVIPSNQVDHYCNLYQPDVFVNFGFRIPDLYWTMFFKKKCSSTIHVQHGIYIDHFQRSASSFFDDFDRRLQYAWYVFRIIKDSKHKINTLKAMLKKDFKLEYDKNKIDKRIISDDVVIWGHYWEQWYKDNLFYNDDVNFHICGGFDFNLLDKENSFKCKPNSVTYICQSLIEDGRLSMEFFLEFIDQLVEFCKNHKGKVYIKLHPRSNRVLYNKLKVLENVDFCNKFPISDFYIGHYSTLLILCHHLRKYVLLVDFPNHPPPGIISSISSSRIKFNEVIELNNETISEAADVDYYCKYISNPFEIIADLIIKKLHKFK